MSLRSISDRAVNKMAEKNSNAAFDPSTILVFLEVITEVLGLLSNCEANPEFAVSRVQQPSFWDRRVLTMKVRRALGFRGFRNHGNDVVDSLLHAGRTVTVSELEEAYRDLDQVPM